MNGAPQDYTFRRGYREAISFLSPTGDTAVGMTPVLVLGLGLYPRLSPALTVSATVVSDPDSILAVITRAQSSALLATRYNYELYDSVTDDLLAFGVMRFENPVRATA